MVAATGRASHSVPTELFIKLSRKLDKPGSLLPRYSGGEGLGIRGQEWEIKVRAWYLQRVLTHKTWLPPDKLAGDLGSEKMCGTASRLGHESPGGRVISKACRNYQLEDIFIRPSPQFDQKNQTPILLSETSSRQLTSLSSKRIFPITLASTSCQPQSVESFPTDSKTLPHAYHISRASGHCARSQTNTCPIKYMFASFRELFAVIQEAGKKSFRRSSNDSLRESPPPGINSYRKCFRHDSYRKHFRYDSYRKPFRCG